MNDPIDKILYRVGDGNLTYVGKLIKKGISVNVRNDVGAIMLMAACGCYRVEMVAYLLQIGADVNLRTNDGESALHSATRLPPCLPELQRDCIRLLLSNGAEVNIQSKTGITPLMHAAWFGCLLSVVELLKAGASLKIKDAKGRTALDLARLKNNNDVVKVLIDAESADS